MNELQTKPNQDEQQGQIALWMAGIFSFLSLAILLFDLSQVYLTQAGRFYLGDAVFSPLAVVLMGVSVASFVLIRRGRYALGSWLMFGALVILPSLVIVVVLRDFSVVAGAYMLGMSAVMIWLVFPQTSRWLAVLLLTGAAVIMIGMELWNPAYRVRIGDASGIVIGILSLGGLALLAVMVRQVFVGNIVAKLTISIALLVVFSIGLSNWLNLRSYQSSITEEVGNNLAVRAASISSELTDQVDQSVFTLRTLARTSEVQAALQAADAKTLSTSDINTLDRQWVAADAANNSNDPLVAGVLSNPASDALRSFQTQTGQNLDVLLTSYQGYNIASTSRTTNYNQAAQAWWSTAVQAGQYIGQPEFDTTKNTVVIPIAVLVREEHGTGQVLGVLRTTVNFTYLVDVMSSNIFGKTGRAIVLLPTGKQFRLNDHGDGTYTIVEENAYPELVALSNSNNIFNITSVNGAPALASLSKMKTIGMPTSDSDAVLNLNWVAVAIQDQSEALAPVTVQTGNTAALGGAMMFAGIIVAIFIARLISDPITRLTTVARRVAGGDLSATARIESTDEVGVLAGTFNIMVNQLRDLISTLEVRVEERTRALSTSTEITRRLATIYDPQLLALEVVEQVQSAFHYYHAHIYYLDEATGDLIMAGGTGEAGAAMMARGHKVPQGRGLVGRAAETNRVVLVTDVSKEPDWLPNALLPETKSEAAIPISSGKQVLGVLDVQQDKVDGLSEGDVQLLQSLASQVAISLQNARSLEISRRQAEIDSMSNTIGQKIQRAGSVEEVLQVAIRELGLAIGATRVSADIAMRPDSTSTASQN